MIAYWGSENGFFTRLGITNVMKPSPFELY